MSISHRYWRHHAAGPQARAVYRGMQDPGLEARPFSEAWMSIKGMESQEAAELGNLELVIPDLNSIQPSTEEARLVVDALRRLVNN